MLAEFFIEEQSCEDITKFVYEEKVYWSKDLKNVKSLTSGYNPDYEFLHDIGTFCSNNILPEITKIHSWKKSWWWINFYEKGHYTAPHIHKPEEYSMIVIVKPSINNCLNFKIKGKKHKIKEQQGLCLIFNSDIEHWVDPVKSERITIAMDFVKNQ